VGEKVYAGQALATIDNTTAKQTLQNAEQSLVSAELQYQQDAASAPINYQKDQTALTNDQTTLSDEYINTFNTLSSTYLDEPAVATGLNSVLYGYDFSSNNSQWNVDALVSMFNTASQQQQVQTFADSAKSDYTAARSLYDPAILAYKAASRTSPPATLEGLITQAINSTTALAQAAQSELNFLSEVNDLAQGNNQKLPTAFTTMQNSTRTYLSTLNSDLNTLLAEQKSIQSDKQAILNDQQTIELDNVGNNTSGSDPISLQITAQSIAQQKQTIATDESNLADYTIVAPFAGTISAVSAQVGQNAGSTVATIIGTQSIVDLSVNEVDAAKIALGQKATLTFDAISGLSLTGTVAEVDPAGTVSQGVVTYGVQISLDTQDPRVKTGMSVNATIQTAVAEGVLTVPSAAIKTTNGTSYVQVFTPALATATTGTTASQGVVSATAPKSVPVTTGISDATTTQILSGLTAGEQIVVRTTGTTATVSAAASATSRTSAGGGFGGGGGAAAVRL
jgi:multidrug efflux pump subunit AcrA (membrane-fusion protein)